MKFNKYKFRCHSVGNIMVGAISALTTKQDEYLKDLTIKKDSKGLTDRQTIDYAKLLEKKIAKPKLSVTAKSYLDKIHAKEVFGKDDSIYSKYMDKGLTQEEISISLYSDVKDFMFLKNDEYKQNDFICGTPDNTQDKIRDIKTSWDFKTFPMHKKEIPSNIYYWQLQCYMELFDLDESELVYCLVDTPEMLVDDEIRRAGWKLGLIDVPTELEDEIRNNMQYDNIDPTRRVKVYNIDRNKKDIELLYQVIELSRKYLNGLEQ